MTKYNPGDPAPIVDETPVAHLQRTGLGWRAYGVSGQIVGYTAWGFTARSAALRVIRRYNRDVGRKARRG